MHDSQTIKTLRAKFKGDYARVITGGVVIHYCLRIPLFQGSSATFADETLTIRGAHRNKTYRGDEAVKRLDAILENVARETDRVVAEMEV